MAQGVPVVAMHRSTAWTTTDGLRVDTGMYLIGMEETSGRKATAVGKPAPEGFLAAASRLGVDPDEMYMVGDDLNNDVLAAQVVGMTGVLVRTGKFRQDTLDRWAADEFAMQPNHVIDSVARPARVAGAVGSEAARVETALHGSGPIRIDEICCGAVTFTDSLDEFGATVKDTGAVVGGVTGGQGAVSDEALEKGPSLRFGVVMHTVREGDEGESVGDRSKVRPERVGRAAHVPADRSRRYAEQ